MGLSREEASQLCRQIVANARRFGGTLVINWHERSLSPERLWGRFYEELLNEIGKDDRVWFVTAKEAVEWFRWRRSIRFDENLSSDVANVYVSAPCSANLGAVVRVHQPGVPGVEVREVLFDGTSPAELEFQAQ
jgi:hypothetical protein